MQMHTMNVATTCTVAENRPLTEIARELEASPESFTPDMLRALASRLDSLQDTVDDHETALDELDTAEGRVEAFADEREALENQIDTLTDERDELAADLETVTQERDEFERQLDRALAK